jgi:hypothetical protein
MKRLQTTVTPTAIREAWATIQRDGNPFSARQKDSSLVRNLDRYRGHTVSSFVGASGAQIQDRLDHGYTPEGEISADLSGAAEYVVPAPWLDEEEGDLLIDQALGGEDLYRVQWRDQDAPRSLTIRANIGFAGIVDAAELGRYMEWVLKVADAARRTGAVPTIELTITLGAAFVRSEDHLQINIPLVRPGEVVDEVSWRAYLAPGALRSLGFVAVGLAADKFGRTINPNLGVPSNTSWGVTLEDDVLDITCPRMMDRFEEAELDGLLEAAQLAA